MKKFLLPFASVALLSGCMSTQLVPPPTDFVGSLSDEYKAEFMKFNDAPSRPFRGGMQNFQFDQERSLLTVLYRLPNPRWYWNVHKSEVEKDLFPYVCNEFDHELEQGLGVRYWYVGNGGFVTDVVTDKTCIDLNQG
ncbi:hypothetical protein [Photobacterium sp. J15]|uniref:hypothetical protein n=1 Tax=Photobacterium sp. J15 TaxID=265901 RepID=UPI0007E35DA6|nr:hypothetical protein [Photobacterium sp. J15]